MENFSFRDFRQQFPILTEQVNGQALIYFDNAATTQKPQCVIDSYQDYYQRCNANVHRASHALSTMATMDYEKARSSVKNFINANTEQEVIWTKGSTESINLVAQSWGRSSLKAGDEIVLSYCAHHANIVPWQLVAEQTGAKIKLLALNENGVIATEQLEQVIGERTKIVCVAHISNVIGKINPVADIIRVAKRFQALTLIDGAQAIAHIPVDVTALGCDFYVFSAHKMYGPTGVGVLYGKQELLDKMPPYQGGGEMIKSVSFDHTTFNTLPHKFEAGTPNIAGIIAFGAAIDFLNQQPCRALLDYENRLRDYCFTQLVTVPGLAFIVEAAPDIPVFSFTLAEHHNHDVAAALDSVGVAIRAGHHCAMPLMSYLQLDGCLRLSLSAYNSFAEVDYAVTALQRISQEKLSVKSADSRVIAPANTQTIKPINKSLKVADIQAIFAKAKSWDSKHREIMLLGKALPRLSNEEKTAQALISGCESHAWLQSFQAPNGVFQFKADSDAKIIRGLLAIILAAVNQKTAAQIRAFDMDGYFAELGLLQHLSPSRGNGVRAIVKKIYQAVGVQ
ncbi:cysteine desulfurase [Colwellia chukchiensis]|uniref:cysteine desulfurase n=1 Tax=Colwellia chukchiensis TaxID=641665 RepID=A0A1H7NNZ4_9GAMM|nr:SufS family cysteine desulfurase [Colwellia chukchiensis]SEL25131.1 cysteine desulfurase [Colwellia chukchiensis]